MISTWDRKYIQESPTDYPPSAGSPSLPFVDTCPRLSPIQIAYSPLACVSLHDIDLTPGPSGVVPIAAERLVHQTNPPVFNPRPSPIQFEGVARFPDVSQESTLENPGMLLVTAQSLVILGLLVIPRLLSNIQVSLHFYALGRSSKKARGRKETKVATDKSTALLNGRAVYLAGQVVLLNRGLTTAKCRMTGGLERGLAIFQGQLTRHPPRPRRAR